MDGRALVQGRTISKGPENKKPALVGAGFVSD
jgi:hypothetical protein